MLYAHITIWMIRAIMNYSALLTIHDKHNYLFDIYHRRFVIPASEFRNNAIFGFSHASVCRFGRSVSRSVGPSVTFFSVNLTRNHCGTHPQASNGPPTLSSTPSFSSFSSSATTNPQPGRIIVSTGTCFYMFTFSTKIRRIGAKCHSTRYIVALLCAMASKMKSVMK